jgi:hydrogenase expression/formation protein HypC
MCLGIPGKIVDIFENNTLRMGHIDYGGVCQEACLAYVPEAAVGDYVIVHAGFAIQQLEPEEALETLALFDEIGKLHDEENHPNRKALP